MMGFEGRMFLRLFSIEQPHITIHGQGDQSFRYGSTLVVKYHPFFSHRLRFLNRAAHFKPKTQKLR